MRVRCKSVKVVGEEVVDERKALLGDRVVSYTLQTTYDMNSVQDHSYDLPVFGHPSHFWRVLGLLFPVLMGLAGCLLAVGFGLAVLSNGRWVDPVFQLVKNNYPASYLGAAVILMSLALVIGYFISCEVLKTRLMTDAVRRERNFGDREQFKVIEERHWPAFVARLRASY
jgi:hypothetical protein